MEGENKERGKEARKEGKESSCLMAPGQAE